MDGRGEAQRASAFLAGGEEREDGCRCDRSLPEVDVRALRPDERCGAVLAALTFLQPGESLVVVAPHDPWPQLMRVLGPQLAAFDLQWVQQCPAGWRIALKRVALARTPT